MSQRHMSVHIVHHRLDGLPKWKPGASASRKAVGEIDTERRLQPARGMMLAVPVSILLWALIFFALA